MMYLSDLRKKEVVSSDGNIIGSVQSIIINEEKIIISITVKIKRKMIKTLGVKKPLLRPLYLDVNIENIKGVEDKVILNYPLEELNKYLINHNKKLDAERLLGLEVLGIDGKVVGNIEDMEIDTKVWSLHSLLVKVKKDALDAIKKDKCVVCGSNLHISMDHVVDIGDYVMLEISVENIGEILKNISLR